MSPQIFSTTVLSAGQDDITGSTTATSNICLKDLKPSGTSKNHLHDTKRSIKSASLQANKQRRFRQGVASASRFWQKQLTPQSLKRRRHLRLTAEMALCSPSAKCSPGSERACSGHSSDSFVSECNVWFSYLDKCGKKKKGYLLCGAFEKQQCCFPDMAACRQMLGIQFGLENAMLSPRLTHKDDRGVRSCRSVAILADLG